MTSRSAAIVTRFELLRLIKSPQALSVLVIAGMFYCWALLKITELAQALQRAGASSAREAAEVKDVVEGLFLQAFAWFTDLEMPAVVQLVKAHPATLVGLHFAALLATPTLAMLLSFDQTGADIRTRRMRYLLLRVDRVALYVGKSLAPAIVFAALMATVTIAALIFNAVVGGAADPLYALRILVSTVLLAIPFLTLMGLASALTTHGALALLCGFGLDMAIWLFSAVGGLANPDAKKVAYAFPSAFKYLWLSDRGGDLALALGHQLAFAALFFVAGILFFRVRDL